MSVSNSALDINYSILITGLAFVPGRYLCLAFMFAWLAYQGARHRTPAGRISELNNAINTTKHVLARAESTCTRDQVVLFELRHRLLQEVKVASKLECRILEIEGTKWARREYIRSVIAIESLQIINKCAREMKNIHNTIRRIVQEDNQRKLDEDIRDIRELLAAMYSPTRTRARYPHLVSRRFQSRSDAADDHYG
ncbi:hypothetical protein GGX14DRAFT_560080 [Mycena pura]|uniref:Uncharacterized protein n=1 Tax=Mycena pura TaxID=153505 RepID=A0AAD6VUM1_9AGAR|nr:hypothetical protein GGX14DRAFT_560080 [Mycena pura]